MEGLIDGAEDRLVDLVNDLNRSYSETYVAEDRDLDYIKDFWDLHYNMIDHLYSNGQVSMPLPSWDSVKNKVYDKYIDLFFESRIENGFEKRVFVLMKVYSLTMPYFYSFINSDSSKISEDFLNLSHLFR